MRKEVLFAIVAGIGLGLILAFGVWRANLAFRSKTSTQNNENQNQASNSSIGLTLASPEDFDVLSVSPLTITGITKANALLAISGSENDFILKSDGEGGFSQEMPLSEGVNEILISVFDENNQVLAKKLLVVYSTEFSKQVSISIPTPETTEEEVASPGASEVREKVQEKVEEAKLSPKFFMGSVTDKLAETIEIKDPEGVIKQISLNSEEAVFIKIAKTRSEVKFSDLAIGDFIIAMGFQNGNGTLDGKRFLITEEFKPSSRVSLIGTLSDIKKAEFTFKTIDGKTEYLIKNNKDLTLLSDASGKEEEIGFADLSEGEQSVIVGTIDSSNLSARTIKIIGQKPTI